MVALVSEEAWHLDLCSLGSLGRLGSLGSLGSLIYGFWQPRPVSVYEMGAEATDYTVGKLLITGTQFR
eukprot:92267-Chlamydomonas_euryale.AAC.1